MSKKKIRVAGANVLIMGITFKANCPDIRNSKVLDIVKKFKKQKMNIDIYDPWADKKEVLKEFNFELIKKPINGKYDLILLAVAHNEFKKMLFKQFKNFTKKNSVIYDLNRIFNNEKVDGGL